VVFYSASLTFWGDLKHGSMDAWQPQQYNKTRAVDFQDTVFMARSGVPYQYE